MKIPNWRTWPVNVFALPAATAAGLGLTLAVRHEYAAASPLVAMLITLGISTVGFLVGYAVAEAVRWLRRPADPLLTFVVDEGEQVLRPGADQRIVVNDGQVIYPRGDNPTAEDYDAALWTATAGLDDLFRRTEPYPHLEEHLGAERAREELARARRDRLRNARKAHVTAMLVEAARKRGNLVWATSAPSLAPVRRERLPWLRVRSGWAVAALVARSVVAAGLAGWGVYELWAAGWVPQLLVPVLAVVCAGLLVCPVGVVLGRWRRDRDSF